MKKFSYLTLSSTLILSTMTANASMTRSNFRCQIEGEAISQSLNSVIRYRELDLSFLKDSSGATEKMNVILRGTRITKISVPVGGPKGNPEDGMSLMINESDFRWNQPQELNASIGKNTATSKLSATPVVPSEEKYELQTLVSESSEHLTFDLSHELVVREFETSEVVYENLQREDRNQQRIASYEQKMVQYNKDLSEAQLQSSASGAPLKVVPKPFEPMLETLLQLPQGPINVSYSYREFENARKQPPTTFGITLNNEKIASLECTTTQNLVDHKTQVEQDVKGKYNGGSAASKPDPRAKGLTFAIPTINRMEREPWCLKKTTKGKLNLSHFNKGTFNVSCEFLGSVPSDN